TDKDLLDEDRLAEEALGPDLEGLSLRVKQADDLIALDQHPLAFVPLLDQPSHLTPIELPLSRQRTIRSRRWQFTVMNARMFASVHAAPPFAPAEYRKPAAPIQSGFFRAVLSPPTGAAASAASPPACSCTAPDARR